MSTSELPPLISRSRTLSDSSGCNTSASLARNYSNSSFLEVTSRSPHSFSSSSATSQVSGPSRVARTCSLSSTGHLSPAKLGTLFEQTLIDFNGQEDLVLSPERRSRARGKRTSGIRTNRTQGSIPDINNNMVRGKLKDGLSKSNKHLAVTNTFSKAPLRRISSDPKTTEDRKNSKNLQVPPNRRLSVDKTDSLTKYPNYRNGLKRNSIDSSGNSKLSLHHSNRRASSLSTDQIEQVRIKVGADDDIDDASDSDEDIKDRVLQWLEEVDREAEVPPEPNFVYEDVPPQTDSAIHIVYGES